MSVPAIAAQKGRDTQLFLWQLSQLCAEKGRNEAKWGGVTLTGTKPAGMHDKRDRSVGHGNRLM